MPLGQLFTLLGALTSGRAGATCLRPGAATGTGGGPARVARGGRGAERGAGDASDAGDAGTASAGGWESQWEKCGKITCPHPGKIWKDSG